jgi:hypothetical protein
MKHYRFPFLLTCILCAAMFTSCGGGSQGGAPPPPASFVIGVSPSSLALTPNSLTQAIISFSPQNGFASSVTLSVQGLPNGVSANFSTATISGSQTSQLTLTANGNVSNGQTNFQVNGVGGGISHDATVNLLVTPFQIRPFPGDFFFRLPNQSSGSLVSSEAYDPALKELFVSNLGLNTVEVYSTVDGHHVGAISVPGPVGLSFASDGSKLVIGTITPYLYFANPVALHITGQLQIPASLLTNAPDGSNLLPVIPYAMADGTIFIGMGLNPVSSFSSNGLVEHLILYDPANGTFTPKDPGVGGVAGNPGLSLDGTHLLVAGQTGAGEELFLYTTGAQAYVAASGPLSNAPSLSIAANPNGSQFACVFDVPGVGTFTTQVNFFGANLQPQFQFTSPSLPGPAIFSRDGKFLFVSSLDSVTVLNPMTGTLAGYIGVTGASVLGTVLPFFDVDEGYRLFGAAEFGGVLVLNASQLQPSPPGPLPDFITSVGVVPDSGPLAGGTQVQFVPAPAQTGGSADGISDSMEAYFGSVPALQNFVAPNPNSSNGGNFLTATTPPALAPGPVTVFLTDANNNLVFLPDAFTYGPHLLRVVPNAASSQGGDTTTINYYGPAVSFPEAVQVSIAGNTANPATTQVSGISTNGFPEQSISVVVPPGTPGWADIALTSSDGTDTLKRSFQYLNQAVNVAGGPFEFAVYDPMRDRFYLTGFNNAVAVFDAASRSFLAPLPSPAAVGSSAVLQGEALTPDSSKLLVADATDNLVLIFDLVGRTGTTVSVMLPGDPTSTIFGPPQTVFVATAAQNRAFVSIQPCIPNPVREIDLTNLSVRARPDAASICTTYVPNPENGASSADGSTIVYAGNSGNEPPGAEYVWRYDATSDKFTGPVLIQNAPYIGAFNAAVDADGSVVAVTQGTLDQRLLPLVPSVAFGGAFGGTAWAMNKTGSLIYSVISPFGPPSDVLISDSQNFRELLIVGLPAGLPANFVEGGSRPLAIDPTGQKILALTQNGVSYFELSVIPLAVGTISPSQVSAGGAITVRGSGFVSGTTVKISGLSASCTVTDSETLSCTVPSLPVGAAPMSLANPDGQTYSFENALTVK